MSARRRVTITAHFEADNLYLTLPSGRAITYPDAHLVPSKFEGYPPDVVFKDNARRQWKRRRGWHGTFTENVVQGTARDILVAAIARMEARGLPVVLHVHDDLVVEAPIGAVSPEEFQRLALEPVPWAEGLPLAGKARVAHCYLEEPEEPLQPQPDGGRHRRDGARQLSRRRAHHSLPNVPRKRRTPATKARTMTPSSTISIRTARRCATSSRYR